MAIALCPGMNLTYTPLLAAVCFAPFAFAQSGSSDEDGRDRTSTGSNAPILISCDEILGAEVAHSPADNTTRADRPAGQIQDLLVIPGSGCVHSLVLESGAVMPYSMFTWNANEARFELRSRAHSKAQGRLVEASARKDKDQGSAGWGGWSAKGSDAKHGMFLLSTLNGSDIFGRPAGYEDNDLTTTEDDDLEALGSVDALVLEVNSGEIAFIAARTGGVLGLGGEVRHLPYGALQVACDHDSLGWEVHTALTTARLKSSPATDSKGDWMADAEQRRSIYSYYSAELPDHEAHANRSNGPRMLKLATLCDADVRSGEETIDMEALWIRRDTGKAAFIQGETGLVVEFAQARWNKEADCFLTDASWKPLSKESRTGLIRAETLMGMDIRSGDETIGSLETLYFDADKKGVAYVTVLSGDILGMGGEQRVLPWSALQFATKGEGDDQETVLKMSADELKRYPKLDGARGNDIHSAEFRARVDGKSKQG